jgi:hypothetical protein
MVQVDVIVISPPVKTQASSGGRGAVYMNIAICEWGREMGHYIPKKGERHPSF